MSGEATAGASTSISKSKPEFRVFVNLMRAGSRNLQLIAPSDWPVRKLKLRPLGAGSTSEMRPVGEDAD